MRYNLHTHTARCNHAEGTDREYVEAAIKAGITVLGFSDHCPQFFPGTDYYSFFRMRPELCEDYVKSVLSLREEYKSDIRILLGFETEYYPETFEPLMKFLGDFPLDYLIMGEHFIGNEYDRDEFYKGKSDEELLEIYVSQVCEGLRKGVFTYLAHPDILDYRGKKRFYIKKMTELCECARELDIPLEYNMLGYVNMRAYPNPLFWQIAAKTGNKAVIGYDAHQPGMLLSDGVFHECVSRLNSVGLPVTEFSKITLRKPVFRSL